MSIYLGLEGLDKTQQADFNSEVPCTRYQCNGLARLAFVYYEPGYSPPDPLDYLFLDQLLDYDLSPEDKTTLYNFVEFFMKLLESNPKQHKKFVCDLYPNIPGEAY